jgi:hypothetical protein
MRARPCRRAAASGLSEERERSGRERRAVPHVTHYTYGRVAVPRLASTGAGAAPPGPGAAGYGTRIPASNLTGLGRGLSHGRETQAARSRMQYGCSSERELRTSLFTTARPDVADGHARKREAGRELARTSSRFDEKVCHGSGVASVEGVRRPDHLDTHGRNRGEELDEVGAAPT